MAGRLVTDEFVETVLALVERVPPGRATTYGTVGDHLGCGPRVIGRVLALHGGGVPWWRVVRADGSLPPSHGASALAAYRSEGTPLRSSGRVDLAVAYWTPPPPP